MQALANFLRTAEFIAASAVQLRTADVSDSVYNEPKQPAANRTPLRRLRVAAVTAKRIRLHLLLGQQGSSIGDAVAHLASKPPRRLFRPISL